MRDEPNVGLRCLIARDQRLQGMSWVSKDGQAMSFQRSNADPSLFLIMAQEKPEGASKLVGTMGLYVDDF